MNCKKQDFLKTAKKGFLKRILEERILGFLERIEDLQT
jgi:hypothetical protein